MSDAKHTARWQQPTDADGEAVTPQRLIGWLDVKFARDGEEEDKWAADYIRSTLGVKACGKCPGCVTGNLFPFDYMGLPMARCDNCRMEVNDATRGAGEAQPTPTAQGVIDGMTKLIDQWHDGANLKAPDLWMAAAAGALSGARALLQDAPEVTRGASVVGQVPLQGVQLSPQSDGLLATAKVENELTNQGPKVGVGGDVVAVADHDIQDGKAEFDIHRPMVLPLGGADVPAPADALRQAAEQFVASCKDGNVADLIGYYEEIFAEALGVISSDPA